MGMNMSSEKDDEVMTDINTTPLIDVMLVLLIMFIITIPVQMHSVNMNLPVASNSQPVKPLEAVKIELDDAGNVYWNGQKLDGRPVMESRMAQLAALPDQPEVHLKPSKTTEYAYVAAVLASAQRIGITKIGIVGNERFVH